MKDAVPGRTLSVACGDSCSPFCRLSATSSPGRGKSFHSGRALGRTGRFRPHRSTAGRSLPLSCKLYAFAKASPFRERWHGEAVTERVACGTNPLSRLRRQLFPFLSPVGDIFPRPGEVFPLRESPWQNRQVSSSPVNGRRSLPLSCKPFAPAKASPFRERWHGEAVTERVPHAKISTSVCKFYAQALIFPAGRATINSVSSCPKRGCGQGSADPAHCREGRRPATGVLRAARAP